MLLSIHTKKGYQTLSPYSKWMVYDTSGLCFCNHENKTSSLVVLVMAIMTIIILTVSFLPLTLLQKNKKPKM